jgi:hypothetical protein
MAKVHNTQDKEREKRVGDLNEEEDDIIIILRNLESITHEYLIFHSTTP